MKQIIRRNLSACSTNLLLSLLTFKANPSRNIRISSPLLSFSALPSILKPTKFFTSKTDPPIQNPDWNPLPETSKDGPTDKEDVSKTELKRLIEKYLEGNDHEDAIPTIFEAILKRKLAGKHDESDEELMGEFCDKPPPDDASDGEFDSDSDKL